jgi:hypothetical protein
MSLRASHCTAASQKPKTGNIRPKSNTNCNQPPGKNQDNGYHTSNIYRKKRHSCQLTVRASYCTVAAKKN